MSSTDHAYDKRLSEEGLRLRGAALIAKKGHQGYLAVLAFACAITLCLAYFHLFVLEDDMLGFLLAGSAFLTALDLTRLGKEREDKSRAAQDFAIFCVDNHRAFGCPHANAMAIAISRMGDEVAMSRAEKFADAEEARRASAMSELSRGFV